MRGARLERIMLQATINSDYNTFVARVALEVDVGLWWKHQLRVKTAGRRITALRTNFIRFIQRLDAGRAA
jgi:hypothetical protein